MQNHRDVILAILCRDTPNPEESPLLQASKFLVGSVVKPVGASRIGRIIFIRIASTGPDIELTRTRIESLPVVVEVGLRLTKAAA